MAHLLARRANAPGVAGNAREAREIFALTLAGHDKALAITKISIQN
jgi:hypothetical protein